jgi:hypothetical protein
VNDAHKLALGGGEQGVQRQPFSVCEGGLTLSSENEQINANKL